MITLTTPWLRFRMGWEPLNTPLRRHSRVNSRSKSVCLLSYTYFDYTDETSGGHNNYRAHSIFSSLQFRF